MSFAPCAACRTRAAAAAHLPARFLARCAPSRPAAPGGPRRRSRGARSPAQRLAPIDLGACVGRVDGSQRRRRSAPRLRKWKKVAKSIPVKSAVRRWRRLLGAQLRSVCARRHGRWRRLLGAQLRSVCARRHATLALLANSTLKGPFKAGVGCFLVSEQHFHSELPANRVVNLLSFLAAANAPSRASWLAVRLRRQSAARPGHRSLPFSSTDGCHVRAPCNMQPARGLHRCSAIEFTRATRATADWGET